MHEAIAPDRRESARLAVRTTFGNASLDGLTRITTGASAAIYRIEVAGRPYLLRLDSAMRDHVRDPLRSYPCMLAAAEAGIAPAVHYADAKAGVAITDFVTGQPLARFPGGPDSLSRELGRLVARLQGIPAFPAIGTYASVVGGMLQEVRCSHLFSDGLIDPHHEGFERICAAYPWDDATMVSAHNDCHAGNILFDGETLWLIDWETAYRNDPAVDAAIMTLYIANTPDLQETFIQSWLGHASDPHLRARLLLMRQLVKLFYAAANGFYIATARPDQREIDLAAPTPSEFREAIDDGRLVANSFEAQRVGCKVALRSFIDGLATPAFEDALRTVGGS